jgi:TolB protein
MRRFLIPSLLPLLTISLACGGSHSEDRASSAEESAASSHGHGPREAPQVEGDKVGTKLAAAEGESHFGELTMLTDGGENAEAYFSFDSKKLSFQSTLGTQGCDQIFTMNLDGSDKRMVSSGMGRTTCAYYYEAGDKIVYASTHLDDEKCPPPADMSQGYVWALYPSYDIFVANADGSEVQQLTSEWRYDAEATVSAQGDKIVFTSLRTGDLEIYTMNLDGSDVRQLTDALGYDGGPFFSPDGTKIVYRAYYPKAPEEIEDYTSLLEQDLIRPSQLEIYLMDVDGSNQTQVTDLHAASFAPFFHPSGTKIIFSTNYPSREREFDLYLVNVDGTGLERITRSPGFDGFPMWAPDGETFVFASNRNQTGDGETNIFLTKWTD